MKTKERTITKIEVYWDAQDPNNEGWAERITYNSRFQESGELCWDLDDDADGSEVCEAVCYLASVHRIYIEADEVAYDHADGGHAVWTR
tara:strand:+ start:1171 stop:1437 length:267 start_codon:yes stop_codon:yes gene_type:complete